MTTKSAGQYARLKKIEFALETAYKTAICNWKQSGFDPVLNPTALRDELLRVRFDLLDAIQAQ